MGTISTASMDMDSSSLPNSSTNHSLDGLILGQKVYFEDVGSLGPARTKQRTGSGSAQNATLKATGGGAPAPGGGQPPRCQVEGCKLDLSDIKAYYSRHKVCIMHSKSPTVVVAGIQQRFCQQCSRFHKLPEFDQGKRSCRRRLAGHNERRRKPTPRSLLSSRYGQFSSSIFVADDSAQGGRFIMDFSAYPKLSARNACPTVRPPEQVTVNQPTAQWQSNSPNPLPDIFPQGSITSRTGYSSPQEECFTGVNTDSTCALSLLSNQPWGPRNRPSSLGLMDVGAQQTTFNQFANNTTTTSWGLHEMSPADLGSGQISQQQSIDGLELSQSRAYDVSTTQHVHGSL